MLFLLLLLGFLRLDPQSYLGEVPFRYVFLCSLSTQFTIYDSFSVYDTLKEEAQLLLLLTHFRLLFMSVCGRKCQGGIPPAQSIFQAFAHVLLGKDCSLHAFSNYRAFPDKLFLFCFRKVRLRSHLTYI